MNAGGVAAAGIARTGHTSGSAWQVRPVARHSSHAPARKST